MLNVETTRDTAVLRFKPTAHQLFRDRLSMQNVYWYDPADDGPECYLIPYFHIFPEGNSPQIAEIIKSWMSLALDRIAQ